MNYMLRGSSEDYVTLLYPSKIDRLFFQHSLAKSIMSLYCFLPLLSFYNRQRQSLLISLIPFIFELEYFLTLDFNIDFKDDGKGTYQD